MGTDATSYPNNDKARNINQWYYKAIGWILEASSDWEWDDTNYTNFPRGTTTLVNGQQDYTLPAATATGDASTFLKIIQVEVLDPGGTIWMKLRPIDESQFGSLGVSQFMSVSGLPIYYRTFSNSIFLYPAPATNSVTLTNGMRILFQRTMSEFIGTDTTKQPGFAAVFHRILSLGGAYDYAIAKGLAQANSLRAEIKEFEQQIKEFYAQKNREFKIGFRPKLLRGRSAPI